MIAALCLSLAMAGLAAPAASPSPTVRKASPAAPATPAVVDEGPQEAVVETSEGSFVLRLLPELAPRHVAHFVKTARQGGYDGTTFHRVVTRGIIQGGDPLSKDPAKKSLYGTGGLGLLKSEFSDRPMARGAVAAVLRPSNPHSAGNQFFIVLFDQPSLTGKFTIFGEVASGWETIDAIGTTPVVGDKPEKRIVMQKVTIRKAEEVPAAASPTPSPR